MRDMPTRARRGFTLIELCCVVGIISILLSIAVTDYGVYLRRSRATEAQVNLETIAYLEHVRILELGAPIACSATPEKMPAPDESVFFPADRCWKDLGFRPRGRVRFQYETERYGEKRFRAIARADLDGDGTPTIYTLDSAGMNLSRENAD
jgi:prepilin-type N-terminal cleavage/methylation domain-containing protein